MFEAIGILKAKAKLDRSEEDLAFRDQIWRLRDGLHHETIQLLGADLNQIGLGQVIDGALTIREKALNATEIKKVKAILRKHGVI
jgi:hypothetical protein